MRCRCRVLILAVVPLLMAALWMDEQPSYRPYEAPVLAPPPGAVPVTGREKEPTGAEAENPVPSDRQSVARGEKLYDINCAMCHGRPLAGPGRVGRKITPPPPVLDPELVRNRSDSHIFNAVTFGFGRMPPFRESISGRERWDLVNFLRSSR